MNHLNDQFNFIVSLISASTISPELTNESSVNNCAALAYRQSWALTHCELAGRLALLVPYADRHVSVRAQRQQVVLGRQKDEKDEQRAAAGATPTVQV